LYSTLYTMFDAAEIFRTHTVKIFLNSIEILKTYINFLRICMLTNSSEIQTSITWTQIKEVLLYKQMMLVEQPK
jgi:hypothetical protein